MCEIEGDGSREGEWKQELCVCVCERERGDGSRGCLIGKKMNNSVWDGDEKETATNVVSTGERESNFHGMSHM